MRGDQDFADKKDEAYKTLAAFKDTDVFKDGG